MGVMDSKNRMGECPRQKDRDGCEREVRGLTISASEFREDREQTRQRRRHDEHQNRDASLVLMCGSVLDVVDVTVRHEAEREHEIETKRDIPCHQ
jgi:hypothetical protein